MITSMDIIWFIDIALAVCIAGYIALKLCVYVVDILLKEPQPPEIQ